MTTWSKTPIHIETGTHHYYSIVFSWDLWSFIQKAQIELDGKAVMIGGPAVEINRSWVPEWINTPLPSEEYLEYHNKDATRTTVGCVRRCAFCAVPTIEPEYRELKRWQVRPVVIDNNLLAASRKHFDMVIDGLKRLEWCDFNQGMDARLMTKHHADRLAELKNPMCRLAFDNIAYEKDFFHAYELLRSAGLPKRCIRAYVLIGFEDTPGDALYRLTTVNSLGIKPNPMRYQPIDSKFRNEYIGEGWTHKELDRYMSYWQNLRFTGGVPFAEYTRGGKK